MSLLGGRDRLMDGWMEVGGGLSYELGWLAGWRLGPGTDGWHCQAG